jgi:hypothetical protein
MVETVPPSLDGIRMRVVETAANGVVGVDTVFVFQQRGSVVTAHYAGGRIVTGFLAGVWEGALLPFRYVQIADGGRLDSGRSVARVIKLPDGRLRLEEQFQWESKPGAGTNIFEEIAD